MQYSTRSVATLAGLLFAGVAAWWLWPSEPSAPAPAAPAPPATQHRRAAPPPGPPTPGALEADRPSDGAIARDPDAVDTGSEEPENVPDGAIVQDPTGDLVYYADHPMSAIPHVVARGWGARGGGAVPGAVGLYVVVDPEITDAALETLVRDIIDFHYDADMISVNVLDSEEAATYDRHRDGGTFAEEHLIATVFRNARLESDRVELRGRLLELDPP